jgi:hypothetical protein
MASKNYFIHYTIDSDNSEDIEEFFKYITSPPAINSFISATANGENITANLPDGCLFAWFPEDFNPEMVYQYFQDAVATSRVKFQTLACVEVAHGTFPYVGKLLP